MKITPNSLWITSAVISLANLLLVVFMFVDQWRLNILLRDVSVSTREYRPAPGFDAEPMEAYTQKFDNVTQVQLTHNLGSMRQIVICRDKSNTIIEPDVIQLDNADSTTVIFTRATSGTCYLWFRKSDIRQ